MLQRPCYSRTNRTLAFIAVVLLSIMSSGCERDLSVTVEGQNPPIFKLGGSGRLIFFYVLEVPANRSLSVDSPKLWEIRPTVNNKISDLPSITYGVVPAGFVQTVPSSGTPPALIEKKTYAAGGPAFEANGGSIWFVIENGKAVVVEKKRQ
jgi:hypothetical protein